MPEPASPATWQAYATSTIDMYKQLNIPTLEWISVNSRESSPIRRSMTWHANILYA